MFEDMELPWQGEVYVIPHDKVTPALAVVEDHLTVGEMIGFMARGTPPYAKVAMAYAAMLRFAGAKSVTGNDVFARMFGPGNVQRDAMVMVQTMLQRVLPLDEAPAAGGAPKGKA
jgi:hypothetical protein